MTLLQNMTVITKCDVYCKMRQYIHWSVSVNGMHLWLVFFELFGEKKSRLMKCLISRDYTKNKNCSFALNNVHFIKILKNL